jgi:hypothetical protein
MFALITGRHFFPSTLSAARIMRKAMGDRPSDRDFVSVQNVHKQWNNDAFTLVRLLERLMRKMTQANPSKRCPAVARANPSKRCPAVAHDVYEFCLVAAERLNALSAAGTTNACLLEMETLYKDIGVASAHLHDIVF